MIASSWVSGVEMGKRKGLERNARKFERSNAYSCCSFDVRITGVLTFQNLPNFTF